MKTLCLIFISFIIFSSCSSLNQKMKSGNLSPANENRKLAATGEETYQIVVSQFMTQSRMHPEHRGPLLEVSKGNSYRLLHHNDCVEVKVSDFEKLGLRIIFFTRDPVDICGGLYSNEKCSPAHYAFSAGSSHGMRGEVIKTISEGNPLGYPIIVSKRRDYSYTNACYVLSSLVFR